MPTPADIKHFAVSYEAFWDAMRVPQEERTRSNWQEVLTWATLLWDSQTAVGVWILPEQTLQNHITTAQTAIARGQTAAEAARLEARSAVNPPATGFYEPNR